MTSRPAAAPYAAALAEVLPVEAHTIARAPDSTALATATTMPRSLNEPVGFWPSTLRYRFGAPMAAPNRGAAPASRPLPGRAGWPHDRKAPISLHRRGVGQSPGERDVDAVAGCANAAPLAM